MVIADQAIVDVLERVTGVAREVARGRWLRGEGHVLATGPDLQLVDAGLAPVRGLDREPDRRGGPGLEALLVPARGHRAPSRVEAVPERVELRAVPLDPLTPPGHLRGGQRTLSVTHPRQHRGHGVVLALADGIELVVMAAGAAHRQPQERRPGGVDHGRQLILPLLGGVRDLLALHLVAGPRHEEARGRVLSHRVPRQLLEDEAVVGQVLVEGANDPVPVVVRGRTRGVHLEAVRLGVLDDVEPVLRPAFSIARAREDLIHKPRPGVGSGVPHEGGHVLGRGQQAVHVEVEPANQDPPLGRR